MRRRLQRIYWIGIAITVATSLIAMTCMLALRIHDKRDNLHHILGAAAAWTVASDDGLQEIADNIAAVSPPIRVTFLHEQGLVLADSEGDVLSMGNHYDRPEVRQARAQDGAVGQSLRVSGTEHGFALYAAEEMQPTAFHAVAREVTQALSPQAAQRNSSLHMEGELTRLAQERDIWEILYNLVDNAIHYGKDGGYVKVILDKDSLTVEDNGVGVDRKHLLHLFEQFYCVDQSRGGSALVPCRCAGGFRPFLRPQNWWTCWFSARTGAKRRTWSEPWMFREENGCIIPLRV